MMGKLLGPGMSRNSFYFLKSNLVIQIALRAFNSIQIASNVTYLYASTGLRH